MKGMFPEYENSRAIDYKAAWDNAIFVFDTNVLLSLYRYRVGTRDELLSVLEEISDRIWIPYQVALEFQRNRLHVIAEQIKRFSDVRRTVEKTKASLINDLGKFRLQERHSLINSEPLLSGFEKLIGEFFDQLEQLEKGQQTLTGEDQIKTKLESLFEGRVGPNFKTQGELDDVQKQGETRYKCNIAPGFEDDSKDSNGPDEFLHAGLIYKRKYGDFILWRQMLSYCASSDRKILIFVTDDTKEDWWRVIEMDGPKTVGPRAELIEEARHQGKVDQFLMYRPDKFLAYAKDALQAKVSDDAIQEVKDLSSESLASPDRIKDIDGLDGIATGALKDWLFDRYAMVFEESGRPGMTVTVNGEMHTYIPVVAKGGVSNSKLWNRTEQIMANVRFGYPQHNNLGQVVVVWIARNAMHAALIHLSLQNTARTSGTSLGAKIITATVMQSENGDSVLTVHKQFDI